MLKHLCKFMLIAGLITALSGCLSLGHLNYKQARMLKKQGFTLTEEGWTLRLPEKLLFGFDQSDIQASQKPALEALSKQLQQYNLNKIKVVGHTDNRPIKALSIQSNLELSKLRARHVADMMAQYLSPSKISVIGRGDMQPIMPNDTLENRAKNRRVEVTVTSLK